MYDFLRGELIKILPGRIILEANGIGYDLVVPVGTEPPAKPGSNVQIWTHLHFKDDGFQLFGFTRQPDRDLFRLLIKVSGVGPRIAMQILSGIQAEELVRVMAEEDWKRLTLIPGIGPKTARRLLIELKEKLTAQELQFIPSGSVPSDPSFRLALTALTNLGFSPEAARAALQELAASGETNLEIILKSAIAKLSP